jgi:ligand-binding sensor domain-containing protein
MEKSGQDDFQVFGITDDKNGNIWVGTMQGVVRYDGETFQYFRE